MLRRTTFALILSISLAAPASAWNKAGHMVTAAIAYDVLKKDAPAVADKVIVILKAHPQYEKLWRKDVEKLPEADRDVYLFMLAARWADDIRGTDYDRPTWHYINYGYKPAGQPDSVKVSPPDETGNIVKAFALNRDKLKAAPEPLDQAVPLCWLFHLIGDVQQPLHAVSLFTEAYPDGDRGGNRFLVRVGDDGKPINLHYFWDGLIIGSDRFTDTRKVATELRSRPEFARDKLTELAEESFENWAKVESATLARTAAYKDGKLAGGTSELTAQPLPADYPKAAKAVGERRAVLAGYRIAQVMKATLGE